MERLDSQGRTRRRSVGSEAATRERLLIYGSGDLVDELTALGLIDEYRLIINPIVVGKGKRLFNGGSERTLRLDDTRTTGTGVVVLTYATT